VVLTTARALGEFGAVSVVSGRLAGRTQTLTLYVEERFQAFDMTGAYSASIVLAILALLTLVGMRRLSAGHPAPALRAASPPEGRGRGGAGWLPLGERFYPGVRGNQA
jgi:ABC-type Fe3+ transport system permease subunit